MQKIDPKDGPAMASGVLSVLYARFRQNTYDYFVKSYRPNSRPPFGVFLSQTVTTLFSLQVPELCFAVYGFGAWNRHGVEIQ
jgi:hypothetical protein